MLTGNPLRPELRGGSRGGGVPALRPRRTRRPIVYVTGGALGSHRINRDVGEALPRLLERCQVIHQCGDNTATGDRPWLAERARALPEGLRRRYALAAYVGAELRDVYAAAALVVGRSGAGTVNECCQLGLAALYVPLPGTSGDEQTANARLVEAAGGAVVFPQVSLTPDGLVEAVTRLLADRRPSPPWASGPGASRCPTQPIASRGCSSRSRAPRPAAEPMIAWLVLLQTSLTIAVAGPATSAEYLPLHVAQAEGFFTAQQLSVTLGPHARTRPPPRCSAAGRSQLAATSLDTALRLGGADGAPPRLIWALTAAPPVALLVAPGRADTIRAVADLVGQTIAIPAPGTAEDQALGLLLARAGVGVHRVKMLSLGERGVVRALEGGEVAAGVLGEPHVSRLVEGDKAAIVVDLRTTKGAEAALGGPTVGAALFVEGRCRATGRHGPGAAGRAPGGGGPDDLGRAGRAPGDCCRPRWSVRRPTSPCACEAPASSSWPTGGSRWRRSSTASSSSGPARRSPSR